MYLISCVQQFNSSEIKMKVNTFLKFILILLWCLNLIHLGSGAYFVFAILNLCVAPFLKTEHHQFTSLQATRAVSLLTIKAFSCIKMGSWMFYSFLWFPIEIEQSPRQPIGELITIHLSSAIFVHVIKINTNTTILGFVS